MSSVINPNNNNLIVAGNLTVEDFLLVKKDVEIRGDLDVTDITAADITSDNITNTNVIETSQLIVNSLTRLENETIINGTLTVNGVNTNTIGTPTEKIEFYYGEYMELENLVVNDTANVNTLEAIDIETDTLLVNTEFEVLGTSQVQDLTVNETLDVTGNVEFGAAFEMLDAEYKKDFFDDPVAYTIFVKKDGDDKRSGRSEAGAVQTIKRGLEIARELRREVESTILVTVGPGIYVEDGGLEVPERCGMVSKAGQYVTEIHMSDEGRREYRNMILCNSGSYVQGFTYRNLEVDDFDDPSGGFAYAFAPNARILRSPYVRDSSQVSNEPYKLVAPPLDPANGNPLVGKGGGMILADRSVVNQNSLYPGFLAFGATPRSPNGLGYVAKNGAFINGISSLTIYQRCSFYALNGGQLTLNNSGTQFGDISLRASGNALVISPAEVSSSDIIVANVEVADNILANTDVIVDQLWDDLVANGPDRYGNTRPNPNFVEWTEGFEYDAAKCERDVGLIINSVAQDLVMRTNYNSLTAGMAYHRGVAGSQYVLSDQFAQTLEAIDYVRDEILDLNLSSDGKDEVRRLFENVYKTIRTGDLVHDIFYKTPGLKPYKEDKCFRDVGFITEAVMLDAILGTNYNSVTAGLAYKRGSSGYPATSTYEYTPTDATYNPTTGIMTATIGTHPFQIGDTILFKPESITFECGAPAVQISHPRVTDPFYNQPVEITDISATTITMFVGDAGGYTGSHSFVSALAGAIEASDGNGQLEQTVAAINYARDYINGVGIDAATQANVTAGIAEITTIIETNVANAIVYPSTFATSGAIGDHANAAVDLQTNKSTAVANVIAFIADEFPTLKYDQAKCERDTGFLIDALTHDVLYGGTYASVKCAEAYFIDTDTRINPGVESLLGDGESTPSVAAYEHLKTVLNAYVTTSTEQQRISDLLDITIYAIDKGIPDEGYKTIPAAVEPSSTIVGPALADYTTVLTNKGNVQRETADYVKTDLAAVLGYLPTTNADDARDLLVLNREFILDQNKAYINSAYPTIDEANIAKCRQDAGFIIDGIVHDVTYGGNFATRRLADAYYEDGVLQIPGAEKPATLAAWANLSVIMQGVVQGTYANAEIYPYDVAGAAEATVISNAMDVVIDHIDNAVLNPLPAEVLPSTSWVETERAADYAAITSAISSIQSDTTNFVDSIYANYFETKCRSDDRQLVESIQLDVRAGTQMVTRAFAQGYFDYKGELAVPENQLPAFEHVWDKAKLLLQAEAGGALTDEGVFIGELIEVIRDTVNNPVTVKFGSLVESLAHQFNNAGAGVNQNALPLNFRRPGFNRPVPFSVLQENGGRVRWSGADEINNQYFAGGTRINGQTGKFEGRPFNISVRAIARRLANSRGGF